VKILLSGGSGFLGSHLVKKFLEAGHQTTIIKRPSSDLWRIAEVMHDLEIYEDVASAFRVHDSFDAVVNTVTCYGRKGEGFTEIAESNLFFPLELLEASLNHKCRYFLNAGTSLEKNLNAYALAKVQFREWGKLVSQSRALSFFEVKLEHFYGARDDSGKFTTHVIYSCLKNVPELLLTRGEQSRDLIHVDDVVNGFLTLLAKVDEINSGYTEFGLGSGQAVTIRNFVEMVHRLTNSETTLRFGAIPYRENEIMNSCADITKLTSLGWRPQINLQEGLRKVIDEEKNSLKETRSFA